MKVGSTLTVWGHRGRATLEAPGGRTRERANNACHMARQQLLWGRHILAQRVRVGLEGTTECDASDQARPEDARDSGTVVKGLYSIWL